MNARQRRRYWIAETNKKRRIVNDYSNKFFRALSQDTNGFLDAYEQGQQQAAQYTNSLLISPNITNVMNQLYSSVGANYAKQEFRRLNVEQTKNFETLVEWFNAIMQYIGQDFYNKGVLRITETTRNLLTSILDKSIAEGWGYAETARYFNEVMPAINRNRAEMIARTESGKAIHAGRQVGAEQSMWEQEKTWIGGQDARTRGNPVNGENDKADHFYIDGQTVDFNDFFFDSRANEFLRHPHDPKGSAASVINCRCTWVVVNKVDRNGKLIRKGTPTGRVSVLRPNPTRQQVVTI